MYLQRMKETEWHEGIAKHEIILLQFFFDFFDFSKRSRIWFSMSDSFLMGASFVFLASFLRFFFFLDFFLAPDDDDKDEDDDDAEDDEEDEEDDDDDEDDDELLFFFFFLVFGLFRATRRAW